MFTPFPSDEIYVGFDPAETPAMVLRREDLVPPRPEMRVKLEVWPAQINTHDATVKMGGWIAVRVHRANTTVYDVLLPSTDLFTRFPEFDRRQARRRQEDQRE